MVSKMSKHAFAGWLRAIESECEKEKYKRQKHENTGIQSTLLVSVNDQVRAYGSYKIHQGQFLYII